MVGTIFSPIFFLNMGYRMSMSKIKTPKNTVSCIHSLTPQSARIMAMHADGTNQIETSDTVEASTKIAATITKSHTKTIPSKETILSEIPVEFQLQYSIKFFFCKSNFVYK